MDQSLARAGTDCPDASLCRQHRSPSSVTVGGLFHDARLREFVVVRVDLKANAVPSALGSGNRRGSGAHEWIEYRVTYEAEHSN